MRTLIEIINAAKGNDPCDVRELRYAVCALEALSTFDSRCIQRLVNYADASKTEIVNLEHKENFRLWKSALNHSPEHYLGDTYNPENPEYQERRKNALKMFERISND